MSVIFVAIYILYFTFNNKRRCEVSFKCIVVSCLLCIVVSCLVCIVVSCLFVLLLVVLCVLLLVVLCVLLLIVLCVFLLVVLCVLSLVVLCVLLLVVLCVLLVVLCVLLSSYMYLLYYVCIAVFTLDAGLLAISQYSEGSATGHLDTGFSWFPCA